MFIFVSEKHSTLQTVDHGYDFLGKQKQLGTRLSHFWKTIWVLDSFLIMLKGIPNNKKTILRRLHFACAAWKRKKHLFGKTFLTTLFNPKQRPIPGFEPGYHPESWWISSYRLPPPAAPSTDVCHSRQFFNDDPFIRWMCDFQNVWSCAYMKVYYTTYSMLI